jgi:hypothetical protein
MPLGRSYRQCAQTRFPPPVRRDKPLRSTAEKRSGFQRNTRRCQRRDNQLFAGRSLRRWRLQACWTPCPAAPRMVGRRSRCSGTHRAFSPGTRRYRHHLFTSEFGVGGGPRSSFRFRLTLYLVYVCVWVLVRRCLRTRLIGHTPGRNTIGREPTKTRAERLHAAGRDATVARLSFAAIRDANAAMFLRTC